MAIEYGSEEQERDGERSSGINLNGDLASIDIAVFTSNGMRRATGGLQHHRTRGATYAYPEFDTEFGILRFSHSTENETNPLDTLLVEGKVYVEVAFETEGPSDPNRMSAKDRKFSSQSINLLRAALGIAVRDPAVLDELCRVAQLPFSRRANKGLEIRSATLESHDIEVVDWRVATITSFDRAWSSTIRNLRCFRSADFLVAIYGPMEGDTWYTNPKLPKHHLSVLDAGLSHISMFSDQSNILQSIFKNLVIETINQAKWGLEVAWREGVAEVQHKVFSDIYRGSQGRLDLAPYWEGIAGVGAAVFRIAEAKQIILYRFGGGDGRSGTAIENQVREACNDLQKDLEKTQNEIRENYHLLGAVSQKLQADRLQKSNAQDKLFQYSIGSLGLIVGIPSLIVTIYAANKSIEGIPWGESVEFRMVALISVAFIATFLVIIASLSSIVRAADNRGAKRENEQGSPPVRSSPPWWQRPPNDGNLKR